MATEPKANPTLATIAAGANCSTATVSRALRGSHLIPAKTTARIQRAAKAAGYRCNPLVSELMRRVRGIGRGTPHGTLAYLVFGPSRTAWRKHLTFLAFFQGARTRAHELGFQLEDFWADAPGLTPARLTQILRARGIIGVIVGPTPGLPVTPRLAWAHFSAVKIGVPFSDLPLPCAVSNHYRSMLRVIEQLSALGYRRLGLVLQEHQNLKTEGMWLAPLVLHQKQQRPADRIAPLIMREWEEAAFEKWVRTQRPDVVIGLRCELIPWLGRLGLRVPGDIGFVHLDRCTEVGDFAGLDQRPAEIAAAAVDLVAHLLVADERDLPTRPKQLLIDSVWCHGPTLRSVGRSVKSHG